MQNELKKTHAQTDYNQVVERQRIFFFLNFGCVGSSLLHAGFLQLRRAGAILLIAMASLVAEHQLQVHGLQQLWHAGSRAQALQLWHTGLVAPRHVRCSQTRKILQEVPCIGRWVLNHWATRKVQERILKAAREATHHI